MDEVDTKNCDGDEEIAGGDDDPMSGLEGSNEELQVGSVSPTNSDLKRKLFSEDNENNLEINAKEVNEYVDNNKRNKSNDLEHKEHIKTDNYEIEGEEQQNEANAKVNGIVLESPNDATDNNFTGPTDLKLVVTVKEEITDTSFIKAIKKEPCDDANVEGGQKILAASSINDEASNNATVPPDIQRDIKTEPCDDANVERHEEIPAAESINDEANNNVAAALPPNIQPEIKVEADANAAETSRPSCRFGVRCYRANVLHRQQEAHPGDQDYRRPDYPQPPEGAPMCPFMRTCYRRNPIHFQQFSHPSEYNGALPPLPAPALQPPGMRLRFRNNMDGFDIEFEGFNDSGSDYEPSDHEDSSDEGVSSGMEE